MKKQQKQLQVLLLPEEMKQIEGMLSSGKTENLKDKLYQLNCIDRVDWSGEEENDQISSFVKGRIIKVWNEEIELNIQSVYKKKNIERGELPILLFKEINKQLKKQGYALLFIDEENDQYVYLPVKVDTLKAFKPVNPLLPFKTLTQLLSRQIFVFNCPKCGEEIYLEPERGQETIDCDCGEEIYFREIS